MMSNMNTWEVLSHVMSLAIAYALALPIGWNREQEERSGGIRPSDWSPYRGADTHASLKALSSVSASSAEEP